MTAPDARLTDDERKAIIGKRFDRDHSTVLYATKRVDRDAELLALAREIAAPFRTEAAA